MSKQSFWGKSILSFLLVLFLMPLGHALMILMELLLGGRLYTAAFIMGLVGLILTVWGVFAKGDTKQTLFGLFGGLFIWTGWIEFGMHYYARRFGTMAMVSDGTMLPLEQAEQLAQIAKQTGELFVFSKPEYVIMPATFGFWILFMIIYIFSIRSGCDFLIWCQKRLFGNKRDIIVAKPITHHTSIVTCIELNVMMWSCYLLLMFFYDPHFIGDRNPLLIFTAIACLVGSIFIFKKQLKLGAWGYNIRMAIATVIIFWTAVEVFIRRGLVKEIWITPREHASEMITILVSFIIVISIVIINDIILKKKKKKNTQN
ncbi:MAG: hypothetical protein IJ681_08700 [Bacteroidales bacterium]|nr:hypothetical protein [Bacteroidales bacterium]